MNLGILLSPGDSLENQSQTGQLERLVDYYLTPYSKHFKQVIIFSYGDQNFKAVLPKRVKLIAKPSYIPNYLYQLVMPLICFRLFKTIDLFRVFQAPGGLPAVIARLLFHKPFIVTYGYDYVFFARQVHRQLLAVLFSFIIPLVLRLAKKIIVTTPENLSLPKSVLIPNGVDPDKFKPSQFRRSDLILSVGRLESQKNYSLLIKIITLSDFRSKLKLVIIGEGSHKQLLLKLAKKLGVNLNLINNLSHTELIHWYQSAAVFVSTSDYEGHQKTLLEAMSCACPSLTTKFSGNPITNQENGLVGNNKQELTDYLNLLIKNKKLSQSLGVNARRLVINQYNIKKLIKKEIQLLSL